MLNFINQMYDSTRKPTGFMKHYYILWSIVEGLEAKETFEFGTGISTEVICDALESTDGKHTSCDTREFDQTGLTYDFLDENIERYRFIKGDSRLIELPSGPFDFVLHDGSHIPGIVGHDLKRILKSMKRNSIIMVHDTESKETPGIDVAITKVLNGINHERLTLPYGYGLTLIRVLEDFGLGTVTPTWTKFNS